MICQYKCTMILPSNFCDASTYFKELVSFLEKYSWLFEAPVTSFLTYDIFSKIPQDWVEPLLELSNEELNNVPTGLIKENWPTSLVEFTKDCQNLTLPVLLSNAPSYDPTNLGSWVQLVPREIWRGMSPKKKDEVEIMSAFVHEECKRLSINKILDIGSGLGYVDRLLLLRGYNILGIESQVKLVAFATMQKENFFPAEVAKNLNYHNMRICGSLVSQVRNAMLDGLLNTRPVPKVDSVCCNSNENMNKYDWERLITQFMDVDINCDSEKVCMIGLHACGDLAITGMKIYLNLPEVSALVLVPCCYHKMAIRNNCFLQLERDFALEEPLTDMENDCSEEAFDHFPLSDALLQKSAGAKFICRPFLRLANQATNTSWQGWTEADHQRHAFNVLSRAIINLVAKQEGATFKKCFRRVVKRTSLREQDFTNYIDESLSRCEFINPNQLLNFERNKNTFRKNLLDKWEELKDKSKLVEAITALQMCLEPVAESLVVADRLCYLQENGVDKVQVIKMIDSKLSPRCLAYVASKI